MIKDFSEMWSIPTDAETKKNKQDAKLFKKSIQKEQARFPLTYEDITKNFNRIQNKDERRAFLEQEVSKYNNYLRRINRANDKFLNQHSNFTGQLFHSEEVYIRNQEINSLKEDFKLLKALLKETPPPKIQQQIPCKILWRGKNKMEQIRILIETWTTGSIPEIIIHDETIVEYILKRFAFSEEEAEELGDFIIWAIPNQQLLWWLYLLFENKLIYFNSTTSEGSIVPQISAYATNHFKKYDDQKGIVSLPIKTLQTTYERMQTMVLSKANNEYYRKAKETIERIAEL